MKNLDSHKTSIKQNTIYILILVCICMFGYAQTADAETLSGATYTLKGSVSVTSGQGNSGVYVLSPSSHPVDTNNSIGSTYSLYSSIFGREISTAISPISRTANSGFQYGDEAYRNQQTGLGHTTSSTSPNTPTTTVDTESLLNNQSTIYVGRGGYYESYIDKVQFGKSLSSFSFEPIILYTIYDELMVIVYIGTVLLLCIVWLEYRSNKKK